MGKEKVPFGHDGFDDRMKECPFSFVSFAENVAMNSGHAEVARVAVDGWIKSPGHCKFVLFLFVVVVGGVLLLYDCFFLLLPLLLHFFFFFVILFTPNPLPFPPHRNLKGHFSECSIGVYRSTSNKYYLTQLFART